MAEPKENQEDDHIDELLSQLKGIFGHLSESEKEEAKQKIAPPYGRLEIPLAPAPSPVDSPAVPPPPEAVVPLHEFEPAPVPLHDLMPSLPIEPSDDNEMAALEPWVPGETPATPAAAAPVAPDPNAFTPTEAFVPEGAALIPTLIFYPTGRIHEAKIVAEKIERITPKFTKVAFVLNVQALTDYDLKADIKTTIVSELAHSRMKAIFILVDKPLDEMRRKAIVSDLEPKGIYFQEIPFHQVEKKAIYTDMLLGMVFFFDSQKPSSDAPS